MFFTRFISRRRFMQWLGAISALAPGMGNRVIMAAPTAQSTPAAVGYGRGAYGQNSYAGTPLPVNKTFLPVINQGGQ